MTRLCLFLIAWLLLCVSRRLPGEQWEYIPSLPQPAGNLAAAALGDRLVCAGGISWVAGTKTWLDEVWTWRPGDAQWSQPGKLPESLAYGAIANDNDLLYIGGGSNGRQMRETLWTVRADGSVSTVTSAWIKTGYPGAVVDGSDMYVISGTADINELSQMTRHCWRVRLPDGAAARITDFPANGVMLPATAFCSGRLYVFGGAETETSTTVRNVVGAFAYDPANGEWHNLPDLPVAVRGLSIAAVDSRHLVLAGGYADKFTDKVWIYDIVDRKYRETVCLPYAAFANLVKMDEYIYWIGGEDAMKHRTDKVARIKWKQLLIKAK